MALDTVLIALPASPDNKADVSIIQIRCGGAKGTLTAWDFRLLRRFSPRMAPLGSEISFRPSMVKFEAPYSDVEVCSIGRSTPYFLNRHAILLLAAQGVPSETLIGMQRAMLDDVDGMLTSIGTAINMVPRLSGAGSSIRSTFLHMLESGLSPSDEPFCSHASKL